MSLYVSLVPMTNMQNHAGIFVFIQGSKKGFAFYLEKSDASCGGGYSGYRYIFVPGSIEIDKG